MKSDLITCLFIMDRNVYNAFKSIVNKQDKKVYGSFSEVLEDLTDDE